MAPRIRTIKPEFWVSEKLGRLTRDARLVFIGLWSLADDSGRFRAEPRYVAGQLLPYDDDGLEEVSRALASLSAVGSVVLYEANGSHYGVITGWKQHQKIDRPSPSRLPQPPENAVANPREDSTNARDSSCEEQGTGNREGNREQGDRDPSREGSPARARGKQPRQRRLPIVDTGDELEPTHQDAVNALVAGFASAGMGKYLWQGAKDGKALSELLKIATLEDVLVRWRRGLGAPTAAWASCRTVAQLKQKWNDLAPPAGPPPAPKLDEATAEAVDRVLKGYPDHLSAYVAGQISQNLRWRRDGDELIGETEDKYFVEWCLEHYPTLGELGMRVALVGGGAAA